MRARDLLRPAVAGAIAVAGLSILVGCGGTSKVSSASLDSRLAPESVAPGFRLERTLDWSDPVNLVGEGIHLPEMTHPSQAVSVVTDAGFEGAAGEQLNVGGPNGQTITTGVMKFSSTANATKIRDWMHGQDLQQPCFAQCIFSPLNLPAPGIANAVAVRQIPNANAGPPPAVLRAIRAHKIAGPPPGAQVGPPTNYFAEFTIGKYLYFAGTSGGPSAKFLAGLKTYYDDVSKKSST